MPCTAATSISLFDFWSLGFVKSPCLLFCLYQQTHMHVMSGCGPAPAERARWKRTHIWHTCPYPEKDPGPARRATRTDRTAAAAAATATTASTGHQASRSTRGTSTRGTCASARLTCGGFITGAGTTRTTNHLVILGTRRLSGILVRSNLDTLIPFRSGGRGWSVLS